MKYLDILTVILTRPRHGRERPRGPVALPPEPTGWMEGLLDGLDRSTTLAQAKFLFSTVHHSGHCEQHSGSDSFPDVDSPVLFYSLFYDTNKI